MAETKEMAEKAWGYSDVLAVSCSGHHRRRRAGATIDSPKPAETGLRCLLGAYWKLEPAHATAHRPC